MGSGELDGTPFDLTAEWFRLGIVNAEVLAKLRAEWDKGEDPNTEHYRYWAFRDFLSARPRLEPSLAFALWDLAESDRDLRWVIRTDIVRRPECPEQLQAAALASGLKHFAKIIAPNCAKVQAPRTSK